MIKRNFGIRKSDIINRRMFIIGTAKLIIFGGLILMLIDATIGSGEEPILTNPTVDIPVVIIAALTLIVLGTLIGLIPAHTAVSIRPIEALREE